MAQSSIVLIFKKVFQSLTRMFSCETLIIILQHFATMKRCAERCTLPLYCTALSTCMCFWKIEIERNLSSLLWWRFQEWNLSVWFCIFWVDAFSLKQIPLNKYLRSHHLVAFSWFWLVLYVNMYIYIYIYIYMYVYGIHHWRILWSRYLFILCYLFIF